MEIRRKFYMIDMKEGPLDKKGLIEELGLSQNSVCIHCDSQSAIYLNTNQMYHESTKQIDVRLQFIRDVTEEGETD